MKKTIIYSLIAILLISAPVWAQEKADLTASATPQTPVAEAPTDLKTIKTDPLSIKRQKIEADLRSTILKLKAVIDRTQVLIDLLNKNDKDTTDATKLLSDSRTSLQTASDALDQFAGVVIPETKTDPKTKKSIKESLTPAILKDPLKKTEDSLKDSKASLIASINALKEILNPSDTTQ